MSATADVSTGLTITFGTSGYTAEITDFGWGGFSRESIDTSHMGIAAPGASNIGNRTFIPGDLSDPGEITFEVNYNPDTTVPLNAAAETITVAYAASGGDTTGADWEGTGFITGFDISGPLDDRMTATLTVKMSGNITVTAGS